MGRSSLADLVINAEWVLKLRVIQILHLALAFVLPSLQVCVDFCNCCSVRHGVTVFSIVALGQSVNQLRCQSGGYGF